MGRPQIVPPWWANSHAGRIPRIARLPERKTSAPRHGAVWLVMAAVALVAIGVRVPGLVSASAAEPAQAAEARPASSPVAVSVPVPDPCPVDWRAGTGAVKRLIACEAAVWDVPGGASEAFDVAYCESRFQTAAYNPTGCGGAGCTGLFQQSLRYWRDRAIEYGFAGLPPTDARANIVVSMRMASEKGTWARDWPVCGL